MMIALAESLIRMGCVSGQDILSSLADNYDPARGYGHGMKLALGAFKAGRRAPAFSSWEDGSKGTVVPCASSPWRARITMT
jgi:hypothetical protein